MRDDIAQAMELIVQGCRLLSAAHRPGELSRDHLLMEFDMKMLEVERVLYRGGLSSGTGVGGLRPGSNEPKG